MTKGNRFTDRFIMSLKPGEKEFWVREGQGFAIRVLLSGEKVWYYIYTFDGRKRFMRLKNGGYPDVSLAEARKSFEAARVKMKNGIDPLAEEQNAKEERKNAFTVSDLITEYIDKHAKPTKRSWNEDERILNKDALKAWGNRKTSDIKKRDIVLLLERIIERGSPGSANNNFKIIRKMFRFAVQRDIIEHSPCDGVVMPAPLNRGDRVLSEAEIKTLWNSLDTCNASPEIRRAIRLILVTGQRPGEVIGMHIDELDGRWWTIPAERSKNKRSHRVYLTNTAIELIGNTKGKGFIFPCVDSKKIQPMGRLSISQVVSRNLAVPVLVKGEPVFDANRKPVTENKLGIADFTPHDLRRTAATYISQLGIMDEIIDAVLNHTKQGVIRTYNLNRYDKEKKQALEAWERKLQSIITGKKCKVMPLRKVV